MSKEMADRLSFTASRLDISKSRLIREALTHYLMTIDAVESLVKDSIIGDFIKQHTSTKNLS
jgi:predicted DNA-binding protein